MWVRTVIDFKGVHYPKAVILHAVFFYLRYAVSYRDLEEILVYGFDNFCCRVAAVQYNRS